MSDREDRAWDDYSADFRAHGLPKIVDSAVCISIAGPDTANWSVKGATELGAMLLLDKPLLVVVPPGRTIGARLRRAADVVVEDWEPTDPAAQDRLTAAIQALVETGQ